MRRRAQLSSCLVIALLPFVAAGAGADDKEVDDGLDVYFREANLSAVGDQQLAVYPEDEAGESAIFERAFPDAPPQISHSVEDMYPITRDDNECLDCHHPDNVAGKEDAPLPESHFSQAVMGEGGKGDAMVWVVKGYQKAKDVVGARYNCSMCHTPQAKNVDTPKTTFVSIKAKD